MKILNILTFASLFLTTFTYGQGEALFKAKCNTCHMVDKNSTGPLLKGVKTKWTDAGEADLIYDWVKNPGSLIASGKSKMALAIKDFSGSDMPPQQASKEEIDQILAYVDNYTPKVDPPVDGTNPAEEVKTVPNYKQNLTLFYALGGLMIVLLLAIILMSNSILSFVKSDVFKKKLQEQDKLTKLLLVFICIGAMCIPGYSYGMSTPDPVSNPEEAGLPWLLVKKADLYIMLLINAVLLLVVMYLRGLFNNFYYMVYPRKVKGAKTRQKRAAKILTDAVPIEEESSILMDHEYDGIRELDNNLPPWWLWGFYMTIIFAFAYILYYHVFNGNNQETEYKVSMLKAQKEIDAYLKDAAMNVDETNVTLLTEPAGIAAGKQIFEANCTACHKDGSGDIGPNLTDNFWLYGNDIKEVFGTVKNGTANGMPEHASKLNPVQLQQVASYVLSLKYKPGKEPQGKEYPKK